LGLYHTFQDGCSDGDFCDDTPPVDQPFTNSNCPANGNSCHGDNPDLIDQWENYMDYSNGTCMAMFTLDQKTRMHGFLAQSPRSSNVSASNLLATGITPGSGAPVANFSAVTISDISCKAPVTARSWTLPGSSVPSSTDKNPTVVYQTPGKYKVTLFVQNSSGNNTKAIDEYIQVISPNNGISPNFEEGFEVADPASRGFVSVSPKTWAVTNAAAFSGTTCIKAPVSTSDPVGTNFSLQLPPVNLSILSGSSLKFTFYAAYAPSSAANSEVLRIYMSTDCGSTFTQKLERSGAGLAYSGATTTSNFVPSSKSQWKLIGFPSLSGLNITNEKNVIFRIDVMGAKGNPVYIDNINISPYFAGQEDLATEEVDFNLFPNPADAESNLTWNALSEEYTVVQLFDMAGRCVQEVYKGNAHQGFNELKIQAPTVSNGALYLVKMTTERGQVSKLITFAH
jgi:PKD repeat protein